ncbi:solute carrier family 22 member 4 [Stylonychia lemnae]|uniref:Solute carrier family 22 member 4 n=1 Tax=Stylonychia lemnae TaxID=5949 RepID=A0A077ZWH3_STYLE|nr:solute carrier family 22 member 4 [Stylonychia lemnae]|eukprot:CDW74214.1 solute carrier family 22 member 4 [Stylonychia lemnae]
MGRSWELQAIIIAKKNCLLGGDTPYCFAGRRTLRRDTQQVWNIISKLNSNILITMTELNSIELRTASLEMKNKLSNVDQQLAETPLIQAKPQQDIKVQDILDKIPFGRFHYRFLLIIFLHYFSGTYISYNLGYLLMYPKYQCQVHDTQNYQECSREYICNNPNGLIWKIEEENHLSLNNWIQRLDLMCSDSIQIGLFGTIDFLSQLFTSLFITPQSDKYGKRWFTIAGATVQIPAFLIILIFKSTILFYFSIIIIGITFVNKNFVMYSHFMDYMGDKGSFITGWMFCLESFNFIITPFILYYISKDTQILAYIGLIMTCIVVISFKFIYFPESLKFTIIQGRYEQAKTDVKKIMFENGHRQTEYKIITDLIDQYADQQIKVNQSNRIEGQQEKEKPSILKLLQTTKYTIRNVILMIILWIATSSSFFMFNFYIKYVQANVFLIGIAMGFSCFGYLFSDLILQRVGFLRLINISYTTTSAILIIIVFVDPTSINIYIYALIFLIFKSFVCMNYSAIFLAHIYLFDSRILATSFGICSFFSRICLLFVPMIVEIPNTQIPLIYLMVINFIAFGCSFLLKRIDQ